MDQVAQKMSGFIRQPNLINKAGFTLVELVIVIALVGVMAMIVTPFLQSDNMEQERQKFVLQLNELVAQAQYNAFVGGKVNRVVFDLKESHVYIEEQTEEQDGEGQNKYAQVQIDYNDNILSWDQDRYKIQEFYINNKNELLGDQGSSDKVWFYIMPDGIAQYVVINFYDILAGEKFNDTGAYSLVLNPFAVQFKLYELFNVPA